MYIYIPDLGELYIQTIYLIWGNYIYIPDDILLFSKKIDLKQK